MGAGQQVEGHRVASTGGDASGRGKNTGAQRHRSSEEPAAPTRAACMSARMVMCYLVVPETASQDLPCLGEPIYMHKKISIMLVILLACYYLVLKRLRVGLIRQYGSSSRCYVVS